MWPVTFEPTYKPLGRDRRSAFTGTSQMRASRPGIYLRGEIISDEATQTQIGI